MSGEYSSLPDTLSPILHPDSVMTGAEVNNPLVDVLKILVNVSDGSNTLQDVAAAIRDAYQIRAVVIARIDVENVHYMGVAAPDGFEPDRVSPGESIFRRIMTDLDFDARIVDIQGTAEQHQLGFGAASEIAAHIVPVSISDTEACAIAAFDTREHLDRARLRETLIATGLILAANLRAAAQVSSERQHLDRLIRLQNLTDRIIRHDGLIDDGPDILEDIADVFDFDAVRLGLVLSNEIQFFRTYRDAAKRKSPVTSVECGPSLASRVVRTGNPQFVHHPEPQDDHSTYDFEVRQLICVPVRIGGEIAGVLSAANNGGRALVIDDLSTLMMLAESIGLVLANFRRIYEVERRNHQLRLVDSLVTFIAERTMIQQAVPEIARLIADRFAFQLVSIGLINGRRINFTLASVNVPMPPIKGIDGRFPIDRGIPGRVIRTGRAELIQDIRSDPDFVATGWDARSAICVPIRANGTIMGVLHVESGPERPLDDADLEVLQIIARHLGIGFESEALLNSERSARRAVEAIQQVSTMVTSTLDVDEALRRIVDTLGGHFEYRYVVAGLTEGQYVQPSAAHGIALERLVRIPVNTSDIGRVAVTGESLLVQNVSSETNLQLDAFPDASSLIAAPIERDDVILGVLIVISARDRRFEERDVTMLEMFAQHAGVVLDNARMYEEARRMAYIDPMTQLPNHRHFQERFQSDLKNAIDSGRPMSILVIDLDGFKETNDRFGHLEGDAVLTAVGRRLTASLRSWDLMARYAGDEFIALLPNTDVEAAMQVGERLCAAIGDEPFDISTGETTRLTASVGVATYPLHGQSTRELLTSADNAMYVAKRAGLNQVRQGRRVSRRM
ncbi:MAG: diguanylate cyclase [Thermomicrobiales bacterium]